MYAKVFASIFDGSMRGKPDLILVFINLLCHADAEGVVDRHWKAISEETGLTAEEVRAAITELESPDKESRSPAEEGRRIKRVSDTRDWGWSIVNHEHYRNIICEADRRKYMRQYMIEYRKQGVKKSKQKLDSPLSSVICDISSVSKGNKGGAGGKKHHPSINPNYTPEYQSFWAAYPRHAGKALAAEQWAKRVEEGLTADMLVGCATRYAEAVKIRMTDEGYVMQPATFLGPNRRWEDYTEENYKRPDAPEPQWAKEKRAESERISKVFAAAEVEVRAKMERESHGKP